MNTTAQIKSVIKKSTQQLKQEPLELLKSVARQVTGEVEKGPESQEIQNSRQDEVPQDEINYKKKVAEQEGRHLQALESELRDIRRQKLFNELLKRIQNGEDVPLEEFSELSYEQKDVLKAQIESVKNLKNKQQTSNGQLMEPTPKKGRRLFGGKQVAKREQTRVEKPVPPSG